MPPKFEFCRHIVGAFLLLAAALAPLPASATLPAAAWTTPGGHPLQTVQYRECSRRSQVFASQDTAWQRGAKPAPRAMPSAMASSPATTSTTRAATASLSFIAADATTAKQRLNFCRPHMS